MDLQQPGAPGRFGEKSGERIASSRLTSARAQMDNSRGDSDAVNE